MNDGVRFVNGTVCFGNGANRFLHSMVRFTGVLARFMVFTTNIYEMTFEIF